MNSLEEDQAGDKVGGTKNVKVFLKRKPSDIEEEEVASQLFSSLITAKQYKEHYNKRDEKLSHSYLQILLQKHPHEAELLEQFNLSFLFSFKLCCFHVEVFGLKPQTSCNKLTWL